MGVLENAETLSPETYVFPATPLQERLWREAAEHGPNPAWNIAVRFLLLGPLDVGQLRGALRRVVTEFEILRTSFFTENDAVKQVAHTSCTVDLKVVDLEDHLDFVGGLEALSQQEAETPFDLARPPLLRATLLRRSATEHTLLVTAHHTIFDGVSVGLLSEALLSAYAGNASAVAGAEPTLQFADYAIWLDEIRQTPEYRAHGRYWRDALAGASKGSTRRTRASGRAHLQSTLLPRTLTDRLREVAAESNVTFPQLALAAFACASGRQDAVIGVPFASRDEVQLETVIGPLVNHLPIPLRSVAGESFKQFLMRVQEGSGEALMHAVYRHEDMLADPEIGEAARFDTVFICQRDLVQPRAVGPLTLTALPSVSPGALHDLTAFMVERSDGWRLSVETSDRHPPSFADSLLERIAAVLQTVCDDPHTPLADLCDRAQSGGDAAPSLAEQVPERARIFPASATQERYWALDRIDPDNAGLNLHLRYEARRGLEVAALRLALGMLSLRHEALRTTFFVEGDDLLQRIEAAGPLPLREVILDAATEPEQIARRMDEESRLPFNLESGPLWRVLMLRSGDRVCFSLTFAHSITDGWSCGLLMRELLEVLDGRPLSPKPPLSFGVPSDLGRAQRTTEEFRNRLAFWDRAFADPVPRFRLPADGRAPSPNGSVVTRRQLDPVLVVAAAQTARDAGVTLANLYVAAYRALLLKYTGVRDLVIATPVANRTPETEAIIGPFADTLLLRAAVGDTFTDALHTTQEAFLAGVEHNVPLQFLVERLAAAQGGRGPAPSVGFMYQEAFVKDLENATVHLDALPYADAAFGFEWHLSVIDRDGVVSLEFTHGDQLSAGLAASILEDFELSLSGYLLAPGKQLSRVVGITPQVLALLAGSAVESTGSTPALPKIPNAAPAAAIDEMVAIWRAVFCKPSISAGDNFFALGGHSMLLARLQVAVEDKTGDRLYAADIFAAPTCEQIAGRLRARRHSRLPARAPRTIALQPHGEETPLFIVSQSVILRELAECLGRNQPTFTLTFGEEEVAQLGPGASMAQVAALYVEHLREAQPVGPYRLGGWCVSGWVAYEMAQQLRAAGDEVDLLLILDAWAPGFWRDLRGSSRLLGRASYYAHRLAFKAGQMLGFHALDEDGRDPAQPLYRRLAMKVARLGKAPLRDSRLAQEDARFAAMMDSASSTYQPAPCGDDRVLIFRSAEQPRGGTLPSDMGWSRLLPASVPVVSLRGDHVGMFSGADAKKMAAVIKRRLRTDGLIKQTSEAASDPRAGFVDAPLCPR